MGATETAFSHRDALCGLEAEEGTDRIKAAFGANYDRLVVLKNRYDPTNLFRHNQNIKPTV